MLDAGGVLLLPDPDAIRAVMALHDVPVPDDATCWRNHYRLMAEVDRQMDGSDAPFDWRGYDRTMAGFFGATGDAIDQASEGLRDVYLATPWAPLPGAAEAMELLRAAGYPMAVVSNAEGDMEDQLASRRICSTDGHAVRVAIVVDSTVVGVAKPDPAIFRFALDALGTPPERCLYIGDSAYFDVRGARAAGLQPVHVDPHSFCPYDDHPHARSLADVAAHLPPLAPR